jgi:TM2 domain-containing membrane protein YozV
MALINCFECGQPISDKAVVCPNCGAPVSDRLDVAQSQIALTYPKSRSIAILLALLLGGLGIHKFYLNRPGWGVIYLLFCWTFIPTILGFLEGLRYLFMSDEAFQEKYGGSRG